MIATFLYGCFGVAFLGTGALALARPDLILAVRARFRPPPERVTERKKPKVFGPREVRICGLALLFIGAALLRTVLKP